MKTFEEMSDEEFNSYLSEPVRHLDQYMRTMGFEFEGSYRERLVDLDRQVLEPIG